MSAKELQDKTVERRGGNKAQAEPRSPAYQGDCDHRGWLGGTRVIHYHGTPMTPEIAAARILAGRHAMVSFAHPDQMPLVAEVCSSFALDNGAFSMWRGGKKPDWNAYYEWVEKWSKHPAFDFALIPDVIDGDESANNELLGFGPFDNGVGVPVWHLHEKPGRLAMLCERYPRIALGSSGEYANIGTQRWWARMASAMNIICDDGVPCVKIHGLRMLDPDIFTKFPFASADSTNVARNISLDSRWNGTYAPPSEAVRGIVLAERIEASNSPGIWQPLPHQEHDLFSLRFSDSVT